MPSNQEKLDDALKVVEEAIALTTDIYNRGNKYLNTTDTIAVNMKEFLAIAEKTKQQLLHPELSIAMVGTTSAGKSTIVNGFAGRRIAPMEAKEMSAGVLEMTHSDQRTMKIHKTENATWGADFFDGISDEEIYEKTKAIFEEYHRKAGKVAAPKISVTGPLEWQANKSILDLPDNLSIKFVDLPGLKTLQDEKNLETIQEYLSKSFCIIAMDFNDVDNSRKQLLLSEVKDIVKSMNNTEFLMFILNKVDCVKTEQTTVAELTEELKASIKDTLNLDGDVDIYPFVAQLYYGIQSAFVKNIETGEVIDWEREKLKSIFKNCGSYLKQKQDTKELPKKLARTIEDFADGEEEADMVSLINFYNICFTISGAETLFSELKRRIAESFSDIVIRPAMDDFSKKLQELMYNMESSVSISRINSLSVLSEKKIAVLKTKLFLEGVTQNADYDYIVSELRQIQELTGKQGLTIYDSRINEMLSKVERRENGFIDSELKKVQNNIDTITATLSKTFSEWDIARFLNEQSAAGNNAVQIFNGISNVVKNIRTHITSQYLDDFRSYLSQHEKPEKFQLLIEERNLIKEIKTPYEHLYDFFYDRLSDKGFSKEEKSYIKKTKIKLPNDAIDSLNRNRNTVFVEMREVLSKVSNIRFQIETNTFVKAIQKFFKSELEYIKKSISEVVNDEDINISQKLANKMSVSKVSTQLPRDLFEFATPKSVRDEWIKQGYTKKGDCCEDDSYVDTSYTLYTYIYPNEVGCYERWMTGFDESTSKFWDIINKWLKNQINAYMKCVADSLRQITTDINSQLSGQLAKVQENVAADTQALDELDKSIGEVKTMVFEKLKRM